MISGKDKYGSKNDQHKSDHYKENTYCQRKPRVLGETPSDVFLVSNLYRG